MAKKKNKELLEAKKNLYYLLMELSDDEIKEDNLHLYYTLDNDKQLMDYFNNEEE